MAHATIPLGVDSSPQARRAAARRMLSARMQSLAKSMATLTTETAAKTNAIRAKARVMRGLSTTQTMSRTPMRRATAVKRINVLRGRLRDGRRAA